MAAQALDPGGRSADHRLVPPVEPKPTPRRAVFALLLLVATAGVFAVAAVTARKAAAAARVTRPAPPTAGPGVTPRRTTRTARPSIALPSRSPWALPPLLDLRAGRTVSA